MTILWPNTAHRSSAVARASLHRLVASVAVASGLAASGRRIDLAGLDAATGLFCAQVLDLAPEESAALRPAMAALNDSVVDLMQILKAGATQ